MRRTVTVAALRMALVVFCLPGTAGAQDPVSVAGERPVRFLGLDLFAGGVFGSAAGERAWGWDAGGTVSLGVRWWGITAAVGRHPIETFSSFHLAIGPRFSTPRLWAASTGGGLRGFAQLLVGVAGTERRTRPPCAPAQAMCFLPRPPHGSPVEWLVGAGVDVTLVRVQVDYLRLNLAGLPKEHVRVFVGGVVPLCLRACRDRDFINVSGRRAAS